MVREQKKRNEEEESNGDGLMKSINMTKIKRKGVGNQDRYSHITLEN